MYGKKHLFALNNKSPGKVVMGGGSCSKGREFKSQHRILDGHFSHLFVVKIVICVWEDENKWKRGRGWPIFLKKKMAAYSVNWPQSCFTFARSYPYSNVLLHFCHSSFVAVLSLGLWYRFGWLLSVFSTSTSASFLFFLSFLFWERKNNILQNVERQKDISSSFSKTEKALYFDFYLPTYYLPTYLPTYYLPTYLPTYYLPSYVLPTYLRITYLPSYVLPTYLPSYILPNYLPTSTYLPTYLPSFLPSYLPTYLPI